MKVNELMVGDWVNVNGLNLKVGAIHADEIGVVDPDYKIYWCSDDEFDRIDPIPLTEEILVKNGFVFNKGYAVLQVSEDTYLDFYKHEHRLRKVWEGIDEWNNHAKVRDVTFVCQCYYVHEFQHALRLCGIDKEISI